VVSLERETAAMVCVGFDGLEPTAELRALIERGVSSVVLFARNYESPQQLANLCSSIKSMADHPVMILIDHEGGRVQRLGSPFTRIPAMREIGRTGDPELARDLGRVMARELRSVGIDMNLAPVMDVDSNPANPVIGERSFAHEPARVAQMGCAIINGLQCEGVAACAKHFPGHGDTELDSHLDLPRLSHDIQRLSQIELPPFRAAAQAGIAAIMTAHVIFEALDSHRPATMSTRVISCLLRDWNHIGFDGLVLSDDMEMKAIADHFEIEEAVTCAAGAGVDLMLVCHRADQQHRAIDALASAFGRGVIPRDALERSQRRLDAVVRRFARRDFPIPLSIVGCDEHRRVVDRLHTSANL
jgi:beta-N-acetylhexosaminidase